MPLHQSDPAHPAAVKIRTALHTSHNSPRSRRYFPQSRIVGSNPIPEDSKELQ